MIFQGFYLSVRYQKRKAASRCSNIAATEEDSGLATVLTTYRTHSTEMRQHVVFDHV